MGRSMAMRKGAVGISMAAVAILAAASLAWACSGAPSASVTFGSKQGSSSPSGPSGSTQTVEGREWGAGTVDVRWNGAAGELLAQPTTDGGAFSATIVIPNAQPGVYTIFFVQNRFVARSSFEVTPASSPSNTGSDTGGDGQSQSGQTSASTTGSDESDTTGSNDQAPSNGASPTPSTSGGSGSTAPSDGGTQSFAAGPNASQPSAPASSTQASTAAPSSARTESPSASRPGALSTSGGSVFAGSVGTAAPVTPAASAGADTSAPAGGDVRSVSGDLYSGFGASGDASLLPDVADSSSTDGGPFGALALAAAAFGASLVALFGGFAAAEVRRRKVANPAR